MILPPDLDELIEGNHPVRVINAVLDSLDIDKISKEYKGGGTSQLSPPHVAQGVGIFLHLQ